MRNDTLYCIAAALLIAWMAMPQATEAARQNFSASLPDTADSCAGLTVRADGAIARSTETFTLSKNEAPRLAIDAGKRAQVRVLGWNRPDYAVEVCRAATAGNQAEADALLKTIVVSRSGANFSANGTSTASQRWMVAFIVHAPSGASMELQTTNGIIEARGVNGSFKVRSTNGPISLTDVSGAVDAGVTNGPITFSGSQGDVRLASTNGPISLTLKEVTWAGAVEAHTTNGPVSLKAPLGFKSGMRVETGKFAPVSCRLEACQSARSEIQDGTRVLQFNGEKPAVKVTTGKGPVSVGSGKRETVI